MRSRVIPGIAVPASALCLGTAGFGSAVARDDAFALLDAFAAQGGTFLDTAHIYASWLPGGTGASERTVGAWLASRGMRARMLVATKGGHPELTPAAPSRLRPEDIARDLHESLERLGVERIDLYWLHRDDPALPVGEILSALAPHVGAGRIAAIGASNWMPERLAQADAWARANGVPGFVASSIGWSLARAVPEHVPPGGMTFMDAEQRAWYRASGVPVVAYSAQANGFFAKADAPPALFVAPDNVGRRARVADLAHSRGVSANALALAWLLAQPGLASAVIGPRTSAQLHDSLESLAIELDDATCAWLDLR